MDSKSKDPPSTSNAKRPESNEFEGLDNSDDDADYDCDPETGVCEWKTKNKKSTVNPGVIIDLKTGKPIDLSSLKNRSDEVASGGGQNKVRYD